MKVEEFDYDLPEELIAQEPTEKRDECRLMVLDREKASIEHRHFYDILDYIDPGDLLVLNDSKVIAARLFGVKAKTGAHIEFLLSRKLGEDRWETLVRPGKRLKPGDRVIFSDEVGKALSAEILSYGKDGTRIVKFSYDGIFADRLEEVGKVPLPPYITRPARSEDKENYQTVYCKYEGSVASPTAGLHFTPELLEKAEKKGIATAYLTLHVGIGTFRPVKSENIEDHQMHIEHYCVPEEAADKINETILNGGKIISVGTTSTRTLESAAYFDDRRGRYLVRPGEADTGIFIYPGYEFKIIDSLITNFHLPKSTLLMLVSALYNKEEILKAYREAVKKHYRFFSYGDAMFIK